MTMNVTVLPGLDGDPHLLDGFLDRQPRWANTDVRPLPEIAAADYHELANVMRCSVTRSPDVLVAESFSGPLAVLLAAQLPNVRLLVLCNTFASSPSGLLGALPVRLLATLTPPTWLVGAAMTGGDLALAAKVVASIRTLPRRVLTSRLRLVKACDVRKPLAALDCRVLALRGTRDRLVPSGCTAAILAAAPRAGQVDIRAPHLTFHTQPDASWNAITKYVEDSE